MILIAAMKRWPARQLVVLFLAVFVTVGMSLSFVQATSNMTAKMAMAADMGASAHDCCQGCPGGGDDGMKAMGCASVCAASVVAVLPHAAPVLAVQKPTSSATYYPPLHGGASSPDPYPPRPTGIG